MTAADWAFTAVAAAALAVTAWAFTAVIGDRRDRRRANRAPALPGRTRTPRGLPRDGAPLNWADTQKWNEILRGWGPGEPVWPGPRDTGRHGKERR